MYAIVKTGGKQYRVEQGQSLLVERLTAGDGDSVALQPLLYVDGDNVVDGQDLSKVKVQARVVAHERGPKLRIVKFKPKRGYKRRTGHRQELTRLEVTEIKLAGARASKTSKSAPKPAPAPEPAVEPETPVTAAEPEAPAGGGEPEAPASAGEPEAPVSEGEPEAPTSAAERDAPTTPTEVENGS